MMAQEAGSVEAVTMGFEDPTFDERPFARQVAARWGVQLHEHLLRPRAVADLPEIVWQYGQPLADVSIVPTYYVAQAVKRHVTVVLGGDGGDELFGGYSRPVVARAAMNYRRLLPSGLRSWLGRRLGGHQRGLLKRPALLAAAGQGTAEQAFVYDRPFGATAGWLTPRNSSGSWRAGTPTCSTARLGSTPWAKTRWIVRSTATW